MDLLQNAIIKKRVAHVYLFEESKGIRRYACALLPVKHNYICKNGKLWFLSI